MAEVQTHKTAHVRAHDGIIVTVVAGIIMLLVFINQPDTSPNGWIHAFSLSLSLTLTYTHTHTHTQL